MTEILSTGSALTSLEGATHADDLRLFRDALGRYATGITLVTAEGPGGPLGFVANSFASVSLDPPLVLWSPARASARFEALASARHYTIHILAVEQSAEVARFGRSGPGFTGAPPERTPEGVPVLTDALARFDCVQHATHDGGDHLIIVGRVLRFTLRSGAPLVFSQGAYGGFQHGN